MEPTDSSTASPSDSEVNPPANTNEAPAQAPAETQSPAQQAMVEQHILSRLQQSPHEHIIAIVSSPNAVGLPLTFRPIEDDSFIPLDMVEITFETPNSFSHGIVLPICRALGHLHGLEMIHRDLKPESVLIGDQGQVKLTGFGSASAKVHASTLIGTPEFMAPEIILAKPYSAAVDWWALGCLVCELLTGKTPFAVSEGNVKLLVRKIVYEPIVVPQHERAGPVETAFIEGLLERLPSMRLGVLGCAQVLTSAFFHADGA